MTIRRPHLLTTALLFAGTALFASSAYAHAGHGDGLAHGLLHPFAGLDHLLAMVAVGLLAWRMTEGRRWVLPASFVGFMLMGSIAGLAFFGGEIAAIEWVLAASVLVFGMMVFGLRQVPVLASSIIVAGFALFHGYAHVASAEAATAGYLAGMLLGTAALHAVGLLGGIALERLGKGNVRYVRFSGAGLVAAFLVAVLLGMGG